MKSLITLLFFVAVTAQGKPSDLRPKKIFMGCRPSPGECINSCPTRRAAWETDATKCDPKDYANKLACYCVVSVFDAKKK